MVEILLLEGVFDVADWETIYQLFIEVSQLFWGQVLSIDLVCSVPVEFGGGSVKA